MREGKLVIAWRPVEVPSAVWRRVVDMEVGEVGFTVPWAMERGWLPYHLNGLNLRYPVLQKAMGTFEMLIVRIKDGWLVEAKEKKPDERSVRE